MAGWCLAPGIGSAWVQRTIQEDRLGFEALGSMEGSIERLEPFRYITGTKFTFPNSGGSKHALRSSSRPLQPQRDQS